MGQTYSKMICYLSEMYLSLAILHLGTAQLVQHDWSLGFGWVEIGDYKAGDVSIGQAWEGPLKAV